MTISAWLLLALSYAAAVPLMAIVQGVYAPFERRGVLRMLRRRLFYYDYMVFLAQFDFRSLAFIVYAVMHGSEWEICLGGALLGAGIGFSFASIANLVVESVPREEVGVATGINTIMRSLGGALGAQLVATLLTAKTIGNSAIPTEAAYTDAFIVAAIAAGLATVAALAIPRTRRPQSQPVTAPAPA